MEIIKIYEQKEIEKTINHLENSSTILQKIKVYTKEKAKAVYKVKKHKEPQFISKEAKEKYNEIMDEVTNLRNIAKQYRIDADILVEEAKKIEAEVRGIAKEVKKLLTNPEDIYIGPKPTLLEWCQQPENKEIGDIIINQYLPRKNKKSLDEIEFDSDETIYIKGSHGSTFKTTPLTITKNKRVLPKLPKGTSYPELFIFYYMQSIFPEAIHKGKALKKVEYDITIPEKKTCIEYNGSAFHKGKYARPEVDANKVVLCKNYGVNYIRIEDDGDTFEPKCNNWLISIDYDSSKRQEQLLLVCKYILNNKLHCKKEGISVEEIEKKIRLYY